jgi:peptide/nickel transport system substrate-binding protein/oligopeptide transport system substrate-binding protein
MGYPTLRSVAPERVRASATTCLALALAACSTASAPRRDEQTLVRLADDDIKGIDPQLSNDLATMRVASEQFEGLTRLNALGQAEAGLAQSWTLSPDGLAWTFSLRPRLTFSDGALITARNFETGFNRLMDPETASPLRELVSGIARIDAITDTMVRVVLDRPVPHLPEILAHPALAALPLHRAHWADERPVVASGAYRVQDWTLNDHVRLDRNPAWHDPPAKIPRVEWRPVNDSLTGMRSFLAGEADSAGDFPASRLSSLRTRLGQQVRLAPYRGSYYFVFNTRKPPFNDARVRKALSLAVDRNWLAKSLIATGVQATDSVVPAQFYTLCPQAVAPPPLPEEARIARARTLLAAAGFGPGRPLRFAIRFNSDTDHKRTALALAAMWAPLGVKAELLNSEASLHFASLRRGDFDLARSGWIGDVSAPENFLSIHRSRAGPANYAGYANADFDAQLAHAEAETNPAKRACAMAKAERIMLADMPVLPLWTYVSKSLVSERVGGWQDNLANAHPSRTLWLKR